MKKNIYIIVLGLTIISITACSPKEDNLNSTKPVVSEESQSSENKETDKDIMKEFNDLIIKENVSLKEVAAFMNENIKSITQEEASTMIIGFEELQKNSKNTEEEKYLPEEIQGEFNQLGTEGIDFNQAESIKDETIKQLVTESRENGYRIETAEGYYFPVIDYSFYKQFSSYATPDIKDYIEIMSVESDHIFAKDAALVITWDEVVKRALSLERFLSSYPDSQKREDIISLYDNYLFITMHGLNNTPLFDYETKKIDEKANNAFGIALTQSIDSKYLRKLGEFIELIRKNDNRLTDEVESFRKENTKNESNEASKEPNRYAVAGIDDADELDKTFELLRTALSDNDKDTFSDYVAYPIKVNVNGKKVEIKDKSEFIKNFDSIISEDLKKVFINQKVEEFFVNQYGIMIGDGEFWISQIEGTKHKFSIYGINN